MLDPNALKSVVTLNQQLSEKGVGLTALTNTPLAALVSYLPSAGIDPEKATYESLMEAYVNLSRDEEHHELCESTINNAVAGVRKTLDYTRNTVMPHVRRVLQAHTDVMASYSVGKSPIEFKLVYLPEVYSNHIARDLMGRWEDLPAGNSPGAVNLGRYTKDEILELAKVSNADAFNEDLSELLSVKQGEGFKQIIEVMAGERNVSQLDPLYSLPCSLVLTNAEQPKEGINSTLAGYNAARGSAANVAAKAALALVGGLIQAQRTMNIYQSLARRAGEVVLINGEVFRDLAEKGLTLEVLMGNELLDRPFRGMDLVVPENLAKMMAAYESDRLTRQQAAKIDQATNSRKTIMDVLRDDLEQIAAKGDFLIEGDDKDRSWQRLRTVVDKILASEWKNVEPIYIIATALCVTWYAHTDAARFIDIMLDVEKKNPGLKPSEFDFLATLQYIASWVASQVSASAANG